jgi:hypothetical protein
MKECICETTKIIIQFKIESLINVS